jgi:hypothetical protein
VPEREVRVIVHAPENLSLSEIAEMFWDKLDKPDSVFEVCAIAVSSAPSCTALEEEHA